MARIRHLRNAPITEALIDVRVDLPDNFDPAEFGGLRQQLSSKYPDVQRRDEFTTEVAVSEGLPEAQRSQNRLHGFYFRTSDGLTIGQFRRDGFTLNRLNPYVSFDYMLPEALRLWDMYLGVVGSLDVKRIAVRYINQLQVIAKTPLDEVLTAPPETPRGPLDEVLGFLTHFKLSAADHQIRANVTHALEEGVEHGKYSVLLDLDVYETVQWESPRSEQMAPAFLRLREVKNELFFAAITDSTAERYE